jgi:hypothetical protein
MIMSCHNEQLVTVSILFTMLFAIVDSNIRKEYVGSFSINSCKEIPDVCKKQIADFIVPLMIEQSKQTVFDSFDSFLNSYNGKTPSMYFWMTVNGQHYSEGTMQIPIQNYCMQVYWQHFDYPM